MHKLSRGRQLRLICRRQLLVAAAVAAANVDVFPDVVAAPMLQLLMLIHTEKIDDKFNNTIFSGGKMALYIMSHYKQINF